MEITFEIGPTYARLCDASGAVALDESHFVAASDEPQIGGENRLKLYRLEENEPVFALDLNAHLQIEGDKPEADIEGGARVGDLVFWVTSHGRNAKGKARPNRRRFFATQIVGETLVPFGVSYADLLEDLSARNPILAAAIEEKLAPEKGGISIEGLCAGEEETLLFGFRSPLDEGNALVVPLLNPREVVNGKKAELAPAFCLDLEGRGIRDFDRVSPGRYFILAGTSADGDDFALYEWNGQPDGKPIELAHLTSEFEKLGLENFHPESFFEVGENELRILSDDGDLEMKTGRNKDLPDDERAFRSVRVRF